jgi:hypothetical protein
MSARQSGCMTPGRVRSTVTDRNALEDFLGKLRAQAIASNPNLVQRAELRDNGQGQLVPERCQNEHEWGPGLITVSWVLCDCGLVRAAQERAGGPAGIWRCSATRRPAAVGVVPATARIRCAIATVGKLCHALPSPRRSFTGGIP